MNEWHFWDDGIIGILLVSIGVGNLFAAFYFLPSRYRKEGVEAKTIKKRCRLFKIFAFVLILSGILTLIGYIDF
ncbi:MAG: hypothetical protein ACYTEX_19245 [Planctomycetota bacterium]